MKSILNWSAFSQKSSAIQSTGCCCSVDKAVQRNSLLRDKEHVPFLVGVKQPLAPLTLILLLFSKLQIKMSKETKTTLL